MNKSSHDTAALLFGRRGTMPSSYDLHQVSMKLVPTSGYVAFANSHSLGIHKQAPGAVRNLIVVDLTPIEEIVLFQPQIQELYDVLAHSGTPGSKCTIASMIVR